jgi:hypothetical protein
MSKRTSLSNAVAAWVLDGASVMGIALEALIPFAA